MLEQQRRAYKVAGVDEHAPALDPRKRKAADADDVSAYITVRREWSPYQTQGAANGKTKKQKPDEQPAEKKNNAVYVSSLPDDVTEDELHHVFSKFGVIAESADSDKPRIKLYIDDQGDFKGDALIGEVVRLNIAIHN